MRIARQTALVALICLLSAADGPRQQPLRLWSGDDASVALGRPSPDGRFLTSVDASTGDLVVRDLRTGVARRLTHNGPAEQGQFAYFSAVSPDSTRIAYAWFNGGRFYELRIIDVSGGAPRTIYRNPEAGFVQPCAWSHDGSQVLTLLFRKDNTSQIAFIPAEGGTARVLKSLNWLYPKRMDLSPDGKHIIYDAFVPGAEANRDLYLLAVDGTSETKLAVSPANDLFPVFSGDGKSIYFASDRGGTMDLWTVPVAGGAAEWVHRDLGRFMPLGITDKGRLIYVRRAGGTNIGIRSVGAGPLEPIVTRYPDRNLAPSWSADGSVLAYLSRRGTENFGTESRAVVLHRLAAGGETELPVKLAHIERALPSPDGSRVMVAGSDARGRGGLFLADVSVGSFRPFVTQQGGRPRGFPSVWSAVGDAIYWADGSVLLGRRLGAKQQPWQIAKAPCAVASLDTSPDGAVLAFACASAVYTAPVAGGEPKLAAELRSGRITSVGWKSQAQLLIGVGPALMSLDLQSGATELAAKIEESQGDYAVHAKSGRVAYTEGEERHELWSVRLP